MKSFIFKFALLVLIVLASYTVVSIKENKQACAWWCDISWEPITQEYLISYATDMITNWFQNGIKMVKEYYKTKLLENLKKEEMMKIISQQTRFSDIAQMEQKMNLLNSAEVIKRTTLFNKDQVDTVARRFPAPSEQICMATTTTVQNSLAQRYSDFNNRTLRERDRIYNAVTARSSYGWDPSTVRSPSVYGPIVRKRALTTVLKSTCVSDENLGGSNPQHGDFCTVYPSMGYPFGDNVFSPSLLAGSMSAGRENYLLQGEEDFLKELLYPASRAMPLPRSINQDIAVQEQYMGAARQDAVKNLNEEVLRQLFSDNSPFFSSNHEIEIEDTESTSWSSCGKLIAFVEETAERKYGHAQARPGRRGSGGWHGCPSTNELKWAEVMSVSNTGYIAMSATAHDGNMYSARLNAVALDHRLTHDEVSKYRTSLLQQAIAKIDHTPIDVTEYGTDTGAGGGGGGENPSVTISISPSSGLVPMTFAVTSTWQNLGSRVCSFGHGYNGAGWEPWGSHATPHDWAGSTTGANGNKTLEIGLSEVLPTPPMIGVDFTFYIVCDNDLQAEAMVSSYPPD